MGQQISDFLKLTTEYDFNKLPKHPRTTRHAMFANRIVNEIIKNWNETSFTNQVTHEGYPVHFHDTEKFENQDTCIELKDTMDKVFKNNGFKNFTLTREKINSNTTCKIIIKNNSE